MLLRLITSQVGSAQIRSGQVRLVLQSAHGGAFNVDSSKKTRTGSRISTSLNNPPNKSGKRRVHEFVFCNYIFRKLSGKKSFIGRTSMRTTQTSTKCDVDATFSTKKRDLEATTNRDFKATTKRDFKATIPKAATNLFLLKCVAL